MPSEIRMNGDNSHSTPTLLANSAARITEQLDEIQDLIRRLKAAEVHIAELEVALDRQSKISIQRERRNAELVISNRALSAEIAKTSDVADDTEHGGYRRRRVTEWRFDCVKIVWRLFREDSEHVFARPEEDVGDPDDGWEVSMVETDRGWRCDGTREYGHYGRMPRRVADAVAEHIATHDIPDGL